MWGKLKNKPLEVPKTIARISLNLLFGFKLIATSLP